MLKTTCLIEREGVNTLLQIFPKTSTKECQLERRNLDLEIRKDATPFYCEFMDATRNKKFKLGSKVRLLILFHQVQ